MYADNACATHADDVEPQQARGVRSRTSDLAPGSAQILALTSALCERARKDGCLLRTPTVAGVQQSQRPSGSPHPSSGPLRAKPSVVQQSPVLDSHRWYSFPIERVWKA